MNLTLYGVDIWGTAMVFARVGAMIMLLPGFGEPSIPARVRLAFALALPMAIAPGLAGHIPAPADTAFGMGGQIGLETADRPHSRRRGAHADESHWRRAGQIAGTEIGIAFAQITDPTINQSGAIISVFLSVMGVALIFATGLDHMFLQGVVGSYDLHRAGSRALRWATPHSSRSTPPRPRFASASRSPCR